MASVVPYEIADCPKCGRRHSFRLMVEVAEQVMTFSGPVGSRDAPALWSVDFRCPRTGKAFSADVPVSDMVPGRVRGVVSSIEDGTPAPPVADWRDAELAEWIKTSSAVPREFLRTMITSVLAAFPVYFGVLKLLGFETVHGGWRIAALVPPLLLLAALVAFVLALRPVLRSVDVETVAATRERRLRSLNRWIVIGLSLFGGAITATVVVWTVVIW